ncbi:hypothetical protein [Dyella acidisoli]|uniref:hypothetical protein n=1 Tax=Dyella acidisoli TaxID=1867834 RepID=UPI0024E071DC|nr:hypothetical protein [Dyella acidisoli]
MNSIRNKSPLTFESRFKAVIPAKAGIQVALMQKAKMDSRFRGNDGLEEHMDIQVIGRLSLIAQPVRS